MKIKTRPAWNISFGDIKGVISGNDSITVTTNYGVTISASVHNIQGNCLKVRIGNSSFASINFNDIQRLEAGDTVIEQIKEEA